MERRHSGIQAQNAVGFGGESIAVVDRGSRGGGGLANMGAVRVGHDTDGGNASGRRLACQRQRESCRKNVTRRNRGSLQSVVEGRNQPALLISNRENRYLIYRTIYLERERM